MIDGSATQESWRNPVSRVARRAAVWSGVLASVGLLPTLVQIYGPGVDVNDVGAILSIVVITISGAVPGLCGAAVCIIHRGAHPRGSRAPRILLAIAAQMLFATGWLALVAWTFSNRTSPTLGQLADALTPAAWVWAPGAALVIAMTTVGAFRTARAAPEEAPGAARWGRTGGDLAVLGASLVAVYAGTGLLVAAHVDVRVNPAGEGAVSLTIAMGSIFASLAMLVGCVAGLALGRMAAEVRGRPPVRRRSAALAVVGLGSAGALGSLVMPQMVPWDSSAELAGAVSQALVGVMGSLLLVLAASRTWAQAPMVPTAAPEGPSAAR
ncbi:hypothetical protein [Agrococcus sp. UYP10]|uniref:hypothetical protein n=1 Tax=Agrococcus sp. UYP10 TaxID=1756355 RepID=UPI003399A2B3